MEAPAAGWFASAQSQIVSLKSVQQSEQSVLFFTLPHPDPQRRWHMQ
jgi:hypothetical protein